MSLVFVKYFLQIDVASIHLEISTIPTRLTCLKNKKKAYLFFFEINENIISVNIKKVFIVYIKKIQKEMSLILPQKSGYIQLIGVQELEHFRFTFNHQKYEICLLPDLHNSSNFTCENEECKHVKAEIEEQILFAQLLRLGETKYTTFDIQEQIRRIFKTARQHAGCLLLSNWLIHLGANASSCIDFFVETNPSESRTLNVSMMDPTLVTIGALFAYCGKPEAPNSHLYIRRCREILPNARFHAVDIRGVGTGFPHLIESFPKTYKQKFNTKPQRALIDLLWKAVNHKHDELETIGLPIDTLQALKSVDKQYAKSAFLNHAKVFFEALKVVLKTDALLAHDQFSLSFRIEARIFDVYTILRMFNNSWKPRKHHGPSSKCIGPPRHIIYFAGQSHTDFFKDFLNALKCPIEPIYHVKNRIEPTSSHDNPTQPNCIKIPLTNLPFQRLIKTNIKQLLQITTDDVLFQFMQNASRKMFAKLCKEKYDTLWLQRLSTALFKFLTFAKNDEYFPQFVLEHKLANIPYAIVWQTSRKISAGLQKEQLEVLTDADDLHFLQWKVVTKIVQEWYVRTFFARTIAENYIVPAILTVHSIPVVWQKYITDDFKHINELLYVIINEKPPPGDDYLLLPTTPENMIKSQDKHTAMLLRTKHGTQSYLAVRQIFMLLQTLWQTHLIALWTMRVLHEYEEKLLVK